MRATRGRGARTCDREAQSTLDTALILTNFLLGLGVKPSDVRWDRKRAGAFPKALARHPHGKKLVPVLERIVGSRA
jgi:hypothetical protein